MSFYLRKFSKLGIQMNITLGDTYTVVHRDVNPEEFRRSFKAVFEKPHVAEMDTEADEDTKRIYAFISDCDGKLIALYKGQKSFVMTERGTTFANVSY